MASSILQSVRSKRNDVFNKAEATLEEQVDYLKSELASLTDLLREKGTEQGSRAKRHAQAGLDDLLSGSEDIIKDLRDAYFRGGEEVRRTVRTHPLATIGAAAAVGIVLALLARR